MHSSGNSSICDNISVCRHFRKANLSFVNKGLTADYSRMVPPFRKLIKPEARGNIPLSDSVVSLDVRVLVREESTREVIVYKSS